MIWKKNPLFSETSHMFPDCMLLVYRFKVATTSWAQSKTFPGEHVPKKRHALKQLRIKTFFQIGYSPAIFDYPIQSANVWTMIDSIHLLSLFLLKAPKRKEIFSSFPRFSLQISPFLVHSPSNQPGFASKIAIWCATRRWRLQIFFMDSHFLDSEDGMYFSKSMFICIWYV